MSGQARLGGMWAWQSDGLKFQPRMNMRRKWYIEAKECAGSRLAAFSLGSGLWPPHQSSSGWHQHSVPRAFISQVEHSMPLPQTPALSLLEKCSSRILSPGTLHINPSKHPYKLSQFLKQKWCNRSGVFNLCSIDILGQIILYWRGYPVHCGILAAFLAYSSC